jgi:hypothetical protein
MQAADFDYELPEELIAQEPAPRRADARLLHVEGEVGISHLRFADLPRLFAAEIRHPQRDEGPARAAARDAGAAALWRFCSCGPKVGVARLPPARRLPGRDVLVATVPSG